MIALLAVLGFLAVMIGIGLWGMKKTVNLNDFFLGGRSIGPWMSAFAYGTSYFSAVVFIGFAGKVGWGFGLNGLWIALGNALIGACLAWLVLGRRTRRMSQNLDVMTMPEFLQERFQAKYIKMFAALIVFIFLLPYSASVFKGLGYLFQTSFNVSYDIALFVMIAITGVYLILGGYFAIAMTDMIQGIIMLFGSIAMVATLVGKAGGLNMALNTIIQQYPVHIAQQPPVLQLLALVFMTSFGVWGMPQMIQKFYAIKNEKVITRAAFLTLIFALVIGFAAYATGAMTHIFYAVPPMLNGKVAFDMFIPNMLKAQLSEPLMALILVLVLSASMSTLSSLILISSSTVAIDLYKGHVNPKISKENSLAMMRFLSAIFIVISYFIARYEFALIITLMSLSWGAIAGSFMAPYIYGLYWKRTTKYGVGAGMVTGLVTSIGLFYWFGPAASPLASSIAMIVPFFVVPLVSWFTKPPAPGLLKKAFQKI